MAVTSAREFFAVLEKSKLLIPSQLAQARAAGGRGDDPKTIARRLARHDLITRWQAGQLLAGRSSFYLGKYRLIELLGRGRLGSLFLGQHVTMNRRVALRVISREVSKEPAALERFLADARAIAALDHPNLVQAYSVDNEGDRYYLVMEYVEGVDLQRLVNEDGPLDCDRAADYICQAADGLEHAHQHTMIHCAVKPSKLLVNLQGVVKIVDLGIAWLSDGDQWTAENQQEWNSVDYLAPEQTIENAKLDGRTDIYSLGCVLYFVLVGHPPFAQGTPTEQILAHQTQELPDIRAQRPAVPAELAAICARMAANSPEDRYRTAADVSRALAHWRAPSPPAKRRVRLPKAKPLEELEASEPVGSDFEEGMWRPASKVVVQTEPAPRTTARQRFIGIVLVVLLVLLGLVVAAAVIWSQVKKPSAPRPVVNVRTASTAIAPRNMTNISPVTQYRS
jgi:eukaryotic-like serine/threonine-protein kinase